MNKQKEKFSWTEFKRRRKRSLSFIGVSRFHDWVVIFFATTILIVALVVSFLHLKNITITHHNIDESLRKIIAVYERPGKFLKYTIILFLFSQLFLFPLSFLPAGIERRGLWGALAERLIPISISALILWIAYKLGAFKERYAKKFKDDLGELEELKAMATELKEDQRASAYPKLQRN